ncbi:MAG: type II toxin-antitoxin system VapC family toxin [Caldilinea sp. CFX5]|nr:type II toxin-antitoxin system VapC family toxin [Caldilinea sp. CFX5]
MIIDSSALFAILLQEPEAERIVRAIGLDPVRLMSAPTWLEISIGVFLRAGEEGLRSLDLLIAKYHVEVVAMTPKQGELARRAFKQYGKGVHPARLNFGDCMVYALAKDTGEPLLFKGEDFSKTDIAPVVY